MWTIEYYNEKVRNEIERFPAGLKARFLHYTELIVATTPFLGEPHTKKIESGLYELRLKAKEGIGRIFFCTIVEKRVIFIHSFLKKTSKTPKRELEVARKRMKEVHNEIGSP